MCCDKLTFLVQQMRTPAPCHCEQDKRFQKEDGQSQELLCYGFVFPSGLGVTIICPSMLVRIQ